MLQIPMYEGILLSVKKRLFYNYIIPCFGPLLSNHFVDKLVFATYLSNHITKFFTELWQPNFDQESSRCLYKHTLQIITSHLQLLDLLILPPYFGYDQHILW